MAVGPGVPEEGQLVAGLGLDELLADHRALVARDVARAEGRRLYEPEVLVERVPARRRGRLARRVVVPNRVCASEPRAVVHPDTRDEAMRRGRAKQGGGDAQDNRRGGPHVCLVILLGLCRGTVYVLARDRNGQS